MQTEDIKSFHRGLNKDIDVRILPDGNYLDAMNIKVSNSKSGRVGVVTNLFGIKNINSSTYSFATNDSINGMFEDRVNNVIYVFIKNDITCPSRVLKYNPSSDEWTLVAMSNMLGLSTANPVTSFDVVENHIKWTNGYSSPKSFDTNLDYLPLLGVSAYNSAATYVAQDVVSRSGIVYIAQGNVPVSTPPTGTLLNNAYWNVSETQGYSESHFTVALLVPIKAPEVSIITDTSFAGNFILGKYFQFKYRFVYKSGQRSVFSPISRLAYSAIDYASPSSLALTVTSNNKIIVSIPNDNANLLVDKIEVACRSGNFGDFNLFHTETLSSSFWSSGLEIGFYNNGVVTAVALEESNQIYDDIPLTAGAQRYSNNRMLYANTTNGYDKPQVDIATSVIKKVLPSTAPTTIDSLNDACLTDTSGVALQALLAPYVPSPGDVIGIIGLNDKVPTTGEKWEAFGTAEIVVPAGWTWAGLVDTIDNISHRCEYYYGGIVQFHNFTDNSGSYVVTDPGDPDFGMTVFWEHTQYRFTYSVGGGDFNETFKSGARYQVGIEYYDEFGRTNGVLSDGVVQTYIPTIGERNLSVSDTVGAGAVSILVEIRNDPPSWARYYSIVWANTYKDAFALTTVIIAAKNGSTSTKCIANINTIKLGNDDGSVLTYSYEKGDRLRFITYNVDGAGSAGTTEWVDKVYDVEIIAAYENYTSPDGFYSIEFYYPDGFISGRAVGARVEIYRPSVVAAADQVLFNESTEIYEISNLLHDGLIPQHNAGTITGLPYSGVYVDGAIKYLNIPISEFDAAIEVGDTITMSGTYTDVLLVTAVSYKFDNTVDIAVASTASWTISGAATGTISYIKASKSPAIIIMSTGDAYFRLRNFSGTNVFVEAYELSDYVLDSVQYSKGRATAIIPQSFQRNVATIFYSEAFIPNTYINGLNKIYPDVNFEEYGKNFGSITYMHDEGDGIIMFQEDKISRVLVNQSIMYDSQGGANYLGSENIVLSKSMPYAGEYGMQSAFSFAFFGNRKYCIDLNRGVALRLSIDGITEISRAGLRGWFYDTCKTMLAAGSNKVYGLYDPIHDEYVISFLELDKTVCYNEELNEGTGGFSSFLSEPFSGGCTLDNKTFYSSGANVFEINQPSLTVSRNSIKTGASEVGLESYIEFVSNKEPIMDKGFLAIAIDGNAAWDVAISTEEGQASTLKYDVDFRQRETEYQAAFLRDTNTPNLPAGEAIFDGDRMKGKEAKIKLTMAAARFGTEKYIKLVRIAISKG